MLDNQIIYTAYYGNELVITTVKIINNWILTLIMYFNVKVDLKNPIL